MCTIYILLIENFVVYFQCKQKRKEVVKYFTNTVITIINMLSFYILLH